MSSDYQLEDTVYLPFTTRAFATGIPTALVSGVIDIYENVTATPIITAETLTVSLNGHAGFNMITVAALAASGFEAGGSYTAILDAGTVDSVSVIGEVVAHFTLDKSAAAKDLANGTDGLGAIKAETALIVADTNELQTDDVPGLIATAQADLDTITGADGATLASAQGPVTFTGVTNEAGITLVGAGTGPGLSTTGGATGHGLESVGGATSGDGIHANADGAGNGLDVIGVGANAGLRTEGGATGAGIHAHGGATGATPGVEFHAHSATGDALELEVDGSGDSNADLAAILADTDNIQTRLPAALSGGNMKSDVLAVSGDATAADNLELMYDGTGYTAETGPASRAQVDNIGAASGGSVNINISEDNTGGAIDPSSAVFVGSVQGGTFASLEAADGVVHSIDDVGDDIDIVYGSSVGGGRTASEVSILANVDQNNDEIKVKAFDHVGADWEIIGTLEGSGGTAFKALDLPLLLKHTGTGAELGKVYIRFETDSTTPSNLSVDKLLIRAVSIGQSVGYASGQIWVNTLNGVAGTEAFVNGVADNPALLIADAKTLSTSVGVPDFHIINGSTITLAESTVNESYFGDNWALALGGQDVDGAYFQGAHVTGVGLSATEVHYEGCDVASMSVQIGHFDFCAFGGTVTQTLAGDYEYHNCYSNIAGVGAPIFAKTAGQAITAEWRNWMDSITVSGLEAGDTITINGRLGAVTLNGADATVEIRGSYKSIVNNLTGSPTVNLDGAWKGSDIADIKVPTDKMTFTKANEVDANMQSINNAGVTGDGDADPWDGA